MEHQHLWVWLQAQNGQAETPQSILVLRNEGYSMQEIAKKLKIWYNVVYYSPHRTAQTGSNQNRKKSGRPRCTTEQEDKYIRGSSLRNRHLLNSSPQLAASLNSTGKIPISKSTDVTPWCWLSRHFWSIWCYFNGQKMYFSFKNKDIFKWPQTFER